MIARAVYRNLSLYAPDKRPCAIDLSDNTNVFGVPPHAEKTFREAALSTITRYPTLYSHNLKKALADYAGVEQQHLVTGCGSDDILDSALRAFLEGSDRIATSRPSFAMIPIFAQMNAVECTQVDFLEDGGLDVDGLLAGDPKLIYVCSPNNPTGLTVPRETLKNLIERAEGLVILDEAYAEFSGEGLMSEAPGYPNLLVIRTMSKAFGLAGLRVGYAVGAQPIVAEVEKSRGPFKVNSLAEATAVAALTKDLEWVKQHVAIAVQNRVRFVEMLQQNGFRSLPSSANFVLGPVPDAVQIANAMRAKGVAVRPFRALPRIGDGLRISIGSWPMMEATFAALVESTS